MSIPGHKVPKATKARKKHSQGLLPRLQKRATTHGVENPCLLKVPDDNRPPTDSPPTQTPRNTIEKAQITGMRVTIEEQQKT